MGVVEGVRGGNYAVGMGFLLPGSNSSFYFSSFFGGFMLSLLFWRAAIRRNSPFTVDITYLDQGVFVSHERSQR